MPARSRDDTPTEELPAPEAVTRLVIRVELPAEEGEQVQPLPPRPRRRAGAWAVGVIAFAALCWLGYRLLSSNPPRPADSLPRAEQQAPVPLAPPPVASVAAPAAAAKPEPPATTQAPLPDTHPVREVLPRVPRSALDTIRGTVRVAVRLSVDPEGAVTSATSEVPGPSRYFERLSLEASKQWRFSPAPGRERPVRVRFHYTRSGVTARAEPLLNSD